MDCNLHSFVRLNVIIGVSSWGWRDICEESAAPQVTGWSIQDIHPPGWNPQGAPRKDPPSLCTDPAEVCTKSDDNTG
jgi:hypothetical protein